MTIRPIAMIVLLSALALTGCESIGDTMSLGRQPLTLQKQAALAVGMDYQTALAAISASGKARNVVVPPPAVAADESASRSLPPVPANSSFGPRIGQYFLADDYVVYRHALAQPVAQAGPAIDAITGQPVPVTSNASAVPTQVRFTYFLVSPKGVIDDYALGTLNISTTACLQIISGSVVICDEPDRLSEDFDLFDGAMRTSKLQPLSSWNVSANANVTIDAANAPTPAVKPAQ